MARMAETFEVWDNNQEKSNTDTPHSPPLPVPQTSYSKMRLSGVRGENKPSYLNQTLSER